MTRGATQAPFPVRKFLGARSGCKVWVQGLGARSVKLARSGSRFRLVSKVASSEKDLKVPLSVYIEVSKSDICFSLHLLSGVVCCFQVVVG